VRQPPTALLIDLDGVLRDWDPTWPSTVETRHALEPGSLSRTVFAPERLTPAVLGQVSHADWLAGAGEALGSPAAVAELETYRGEVNPDVLSLVRQVRAAGIPVGLATNATDKLDADLDLLGLAGELDAVVNSSRLGVAKPSGGYYRAACLALDTPPARCLLVDDSDRFTRGARAAGLSALRYTGSAGDRGYVRAVLGLRSTQPAS
jgi:putative hydrolase of the HAD superfamily